MDLQLLLVLTASLLAVLYLGRQSWRTWTGGCGKSCGGASTAPATPAWIDVEELTRRVKQRRSG